MDASKHYVLVLCENVDANGLRDYVFIEKVKPDWQAGKLNLPGGKMESFDGGCPMEAAKRELLEETGLYADDYQKVGTMLDGDKTIHCVLATFSLYDDLSRDDRPLKPREGEVEVPFWSPWKNVLNDRRLIPNLRVIVPLMISGVKNFIIEDHTRCSDGTHHEIRVSVPTLNK